MNRTIIAVAAFVMGITASAYGATVGNKADVLGGAGNFALGLDLDMVTDRDLEYDTGTPAQNVTDASFESNRYALKGTVGVGAMVDVLLKIGMADAESEHTAGGNYTIDGDNDVLWGLGVKARLWTSPGGMKILADAQYLNYEMDADCKVGGANCASPFNYDTSEITEWQVAAYVNQTMGNWSPYGGIKYSDVKVEHSGPGGSIEFNADDVVGLFVGTDIMVPANPNLSFNIEGRFIDETAFSLGATWMF